jgi:hypothetical protein
MKAGRADDLQTSLFQQSFKDFRAFPVIITKQNLGHGTFRLRMNEIFEALYAEKGGGEKGRK